MPFITERELKTHFGARRRSDRRDIRRCEPDTAEQIRWRQADLAARALAVAERQRAFPVITPENVDAALACQETAIVEERARLLASSEAA